METAKDIWFPRRRHHVRPSIRLFCFAYAGGGASIFRTWPEALPPHVEICPVQLPGLEARLTETSYRRMQPTVEALAQALSLYMTTPMAFFGHSMGALIAFELARFLRRRHALLPANLFVSGCRAPHLPNIDRPLHLLPDSELIDELRTLRGTPEAVLQNAELMRLVLPRLRADLELCATYVYSPEPPLACPISAFGGIEDSKVSQADVAGWREQTTEAFTLRFWPGDHFFLKSAQSDLLKAIFLELAHA